MAIVEPVLAYPAEPELKLHVKAPAPHAAPTAEKSKKPGLAILSWNADGKPVRLGPGPKLLLKELVKAGQDVLNGADWAEAFIKSDELRARLGEQLGVTLEPKTFYDWVRKLRNALLKTRQVFKNAPSPSKDWRTQVIEYTADYGYRLGIPPDRVQ